MTAGDLEAIAFQIISNVGTAKSLAMEALYDAKKGDFSSAETKLEEAREYFVEGHKAHSDMIQKEAAGEQVTLTLLIMHAEDQLMNTETIIELVNEMIDIHRKIND